MPITEGIVVLSAVVAYELVRRYGAERRQQRRVGRELGRPAPPAAGTEVVTA